MERNNQAQYLSITLAFMNVPDYVSSVAISRGILQFSRKHTTFSNWLRILTLSYIQMCRRFNSLQPNNPHFFFLFLVIINSVPLNFVDPTKLHGLIMSL